MSMVLPFKSRIHTSGLSGLYFKMPKSWQEKRRQRMLEAKFPIELVTQLCGEWNFREWFDRASEPGGVSV